MKASSQRRRRKKEDQCDRRPETEETSKDREDRRGQTSVMEVIAKEDVKIERRIGGNNKAATKNGEDRGDRKVGPIATARVKQPS